MDILIKWNECINDWIENIKKYIYKIEDYGIRILGIEWTNSIVKLNLLKVIELNDLIKYFDNMESIISQLMDITHIILNKQVYAEFKSNTSYMDIMNEYVTNINKNIELSNEIYNIVSNNHNPIHITDLNHGYIVLKRYIHTLHDEGLIDNIKKIKDSIMLQYKYTIDKDLHPLHKINYLILPFKPSLNNIKFFINISTSKNIISYNIMPLINKLDAVKFGPIQRISQGIDKSMINRFNTISITQHIYNIDNALNKVKNGAVIYDGSNYKEIIPINMKKNIQWCPLSGVCSTVYKLNEIFQSNVLNVMKIDTSVYEKYIIEQRSIKRNTLMDTMQYELKKYKDRTVEQIVFKICFDEIKHRISKLKESNVYKLDTIKKEAYLSQFFNAMSISRSIHKKDFNSIELIPSKYSFTYFKLN